MTAQEDERQAGHVRPLTSLRFLAALWVVLFHYWPKLDVGFTPTFVAKGYLGVEMFFVLSGFILCHVYLASVGNGRFRYFSFLWARLARVYPLHLATLAGVGVLGVGAAVAGFSVDANLTDLRALPANLLMVHAWGLSPVAGWNHPSWSISAEWFAYLSFPLFAFAALKLRRRPLVASALALALLFGLYLGFERVAGFPLTQATINWGALRIVPCFAYGCAAYLMFHAGALPERRMALSVSLVTTLLIALLAHAGAADGLLVALFGMLILSLACAWRAGSAVLSNPVSVWLGEISYSVYMVCVPWKIVFVNGAVRLLGLPEERLPLWLWLVFLAGVVPLAALSHHLLERPARTAMKRWGHVRRIGAQAA